MGTKNSVITILLFLLISNLYLFAQNYDLETATAEEDRIEATTKPELAKQIAEKWYNRGDKELALEFDKLYINAFPNYGVGVAKEWYKRGEKNFAIEFFNSESKTSPYLADFLADILYDLGEKELAVEFEKLFLKDQPDNSLSVADKWYKRGEKKPAIEFDKLYIQNNPLESSPISDKWFKRGEKKIAAEFDKFALEHYLYLVTTIYKASPSAISDKASSIATQWYKRGENEIASEFEQISLQTGPRNALKKFDELIKAGNFSQAEKLGNQLLEFWVSESDIKIKDNLDLKLKLAALMDSKYYYEILNSKQSKISNDDIIQNYTKFLENVSLNPVVKDISITDYLTHRTVINPEFLEKFNIPLDEARKMLEMDLYELAKKSDITFSILHVIALYAKQDPNFKLHIFYENPLGESTTVGTYWQELQRVQINKFPLRSNIIRGVIIHEWTHQAMHLLFHNNFNPYSDHDTIAKNKWNKIMEDMVQSLKKQPLKFKLALIFDPNPFARAISSFDTAFKAYPEISQSPETIARFVEMIGNNDYENPQVKELLQPIYDYWMQFINPAIEKYVKKYAKLDTFVSDWERENVLDPFYRIEVQRDEYTRDLLTVQSDPEKAKFIADKWFLRGDAIRALDFDKLYIQHFPDQSSAIAHKWFDRKEYEIALEFDYSLYSILRDRAYRLFHYVFIE